MMNGGDLILLDDIKVVWGVCNDDDTDSDEDGYDDDADVDKNMRIYGVACGQE